MSQSVLTTLAVPSNTVFVSVASMWEIAIKASTGKLEFPTDRFDEMFALNRFAPLPIEPRHALAAGALPRYHNDPFDRMLIAQARIEGLILVTADAAFRRYDVSLLEN